MKNYEVKAIIETGAECVDIIPDDSEIMADSVEEAIDCVICDLMEQAAFSDYNAERYNNYKFAIYDQSNNVICVYKFKARLTFDNKEIEGAEWEKPEYCGTVTDTTEETKKDIAKKYEAEGLTEAGQWVPLFNDLIDNAETDTDALHVARERMLKKGHNISVRVRAYYYNRITGVGCYSHSWTEQPKAEETEETAQTTEETAETTEETSETTEETSETTEETAETTEATAETTEATAETTEETAETTEETAEATAQPTAETTEATAETEAVLNSCYGMCVTAPPPTETTGQTTETTGATSPPPETHPTETTGATSPPPETHPTETTGATSPPTEATPPPTETTGKEVTGVTIIEYRQYNNGDKVIIKHNCFYNADEIIDNYHATDPSYICKYKGLMFGKDDNDYYVSEFHHEEQYL